MKSKWTNFEYQDYDDLQVSFKFIVFLEDLGIKCATDLADDVNGIIDEYCEDCTAIKGECSCGRYEIDNDWDRFDHAYGSWKDYQLEKKLEGQSDS